MKKILLHSAAVDALGLYHDAGSELTIGDANEAGYIAADRARGLVDSGRAVDPAKAADEGDELDRLKLAELRTLAEDERVDLGELTLKADIAAAIRAARLNPPSELADTIRSPMLDGNDTDALIAG